MLIRGKDIFILSLVTFITVVAWLAFDIHHASTMSTIKPPAEKLLKPLSPNIDTDLIRELKQLPE
jgi:hypothetical protein